MGDRPDCRMCGTPAHRYDPTDPEHKYDAVACVDTLRSQVERYREVVEAAQELDFQPCDFAGAEPKPGLRRWCLEHGEYDRGSGCPVGNFCAALARLDADPPREPEGAEG